MKMGTVLTNKDLINDFVFFTCYCLFFLIFLTAFVSPSYQVIINVNSINEALLEFILFSGLFVYGLLRLVWDIMRKTHTRRERVYLFLLFGFLFLIIVLAIPI